MRTLLNLYRNVFMGTGGISVFSMRSVQLNIVLMARSLWFKEIHRSRLGKAFLIDVRPFDIVPVVPGTIFMLKIPNLMFVPPPPPFFLTLGMVKQNVNC